MDVTTSNNSQPAYCYNYRDSFPSIPGAPKYYAEVPLYQTKTPNEDMEEVLQSCCHSKVWLYSNPEPCTAVCNSSSEKQAQDVSYCLNSKDIEYGGNSIDSGADPHVSVSNGAWTVLFVSVLLVSGMMM
ncbi:hypothetical protein N7540_001805 [Penicillium herquei]|nr:hypothetical protein N7540_001805 [Penicillium herquei]